MDPICVLSDIHGNLAALKAVLEQLEKLGVKRYYTLGDTVGYGPFPVECFRLVRDCFDLMLMGNHEYAAFHRAWQDFNPLATKAIRWTREQLEAAGELVHLEPLTSSKQVGNALFVHGNVHDPLNAYVRERDARGLSSFDEVAKELERDFQDFDLCFVGHNHQPFLCTNEGFIHPHERMHEFKITGEKLYVCVGSVGQPRDGDPRACFVIYNGDRVTYHRVHYDVQSTVDAIRAAGLPEPLAQRLLVGR
jgi:predicted phosphodiesterase